MVTVEGVDDIAFPNAVGLLGAYQNTLPDVSIQWVAIAGLVLSLVSIGILAYQLIQKRLMRDEQWKYETMLSRRDVLRRLVGNTFRLTVGFNASDGEPYIALNEAWMVFSDCPEVKQALRTYHNEMNNPDTHNQNMLAIIEKMAKRSKVPIDFSDYNFLERPFTPPPPITLPSASLLPASPPTNSPSEQVDQDSN